MNTIEVNTYKFGTVEIPKSKIIHFPKGIIGFPKLTEFVLMHDSEDKEPAIYYLQSVRDKDFALTVTDPLLITSKYVPDVIEADIPDASSLNDDNILVLVTLTVPEDAKQTTANLQAPIIINTDTMAGVQVLTQNGYSIKYPKYNNLDGSKKG